MIRRTLAMILKERESADRARDATGSGFASPYCEYQCCYRSMAVNEALWRCERAYGQGRDVEERGERREDSGNQGAILCDRPELVG